MRRLVICSALLLAGCATFTKVTGPYRASLSRADVQSIVQLGQKVKAGHYTTMTLTAVAADEVWVECYQGPLEFGFVALRHEGTWKLGKYRPGHSVLAE